MTMFLNDDFEKTYKGEVSKSGAAVLPSKRIRRVAEKKPQDLKPLDVSDKNEPAQEEPKSPSPEENKTE